MISNGCPFCRCWRRIINLVWAIIERIGDWQTCRRYEQEQAERMAIEDARRRVRAWHSTRKEMEQTLARRVSEREEP